MENKKNLKGGTIYTTYKGDFKISVRSIDRDAEVTEGDNSCPCRGKINLYELRKIMEKKGYL